MLYWVVSTKVLLKAIDTKVLSQTVKEVTIAYNNYQPEQLTMVETHNSVEKEGDIDDEQMSNYTKDAHRFVMLIIPDVLVH